MLSVIVISGSLFVIAGAIGITMLFSAFKHMP
jgi:hypothetical protein